MLINRTKHRLDKIASRLNLLHGYLIAHLNIDEVIHIIREHDDPKPNSRRAFKLNEIQAEAILNMRLRALRKLEEIQIKQEISDLETEKLKGGIATVRNKTVVHHKKSSNSSLDF